jgi:hypothetical protein
MPFGPRPLLRPRSIAVLQCHVLPGDTGAYEQTPSKHASFVGRSSSRAVREVSLVSADDTGRRIYITSLGSPRSSILRVQNAAGVILGSVGVTAVTWCAAANPVFERYTPLHQEGHPRSGAVIRLG